MARETHDSRTLTDAERDAVEQGRLFGRLPLALRDAILGRAYVWRFKDGERVLPAGAQPGHWLGVASGELLGRTCSAQEGQSIPTHLLGPGAWMTLYSPVCVVRRRGIEFVASGPTCVLAVSRDDTLELCSRGPELVMAMLSLCAINLRYAHLIVQEAQTSTLEQTLLRWLESGVQIEDGRRDGSFKVYRSVVPQAALALSSGVSRQSWNAGMARLEAMGLLERVKEGLRVPDSARLEAALKERGLRETARYLQADAQPVSAAAPLDAEPLPIRALRDDERSALDSCPWYMRLSQPLRDKLLPQLQVLRLRDQAQVAAVDHRPPGWVAVLRGGLRLVSRAPFTDPATPGRRPGTVLAEMPPGSTFFEHALIDGGNSGVDVGCEGDTTLLLLKQDPFLALMAAEPEFRLGLLHWLGICHHQICIMKLTLALPMPERLQGWLHVLGHQRGAADGPWVTIPMKLTLQEIASSLGTTRQYVAKALKELEGAGAVVRLPDSIKMRGDLFPRLGAYEGLRARHEAARHR
ncbi:Crp/Fnr family transcriptional regulator [Ideonella sp. YS5]|uniref:Crp/Fnr family transcriptional regulator n=1 Tax=Ideonella sp. YS5 TaxID=3453714 RepID=UPI003EEAAA06